jgi:hypothetical protein
LKPTPSLVSKVFCLTSCLVCAAVLLRPAPAEPLEPAGPPAELVQAPAQAPAEAEADLYDGPITEMISRADFEALRPIHQGMIRRLADGKTADAINLACACFTPNVDPVTVQSFLDVIERLYPDRYNQTSRWSGTVASGSAGAFGEPSS